MRNYDRCNSITITGINNFFLVQNDYGYSFGEGNHELDVIIWMWVSDLLEVCLFTTAWFSVSYLTDQSSVEARGSFLKVTQRSAGGWEFTLDTLEPQNMSEREEKGGNKFKGRLTDIMSICHLAPRAIKGPCEWSLLSEQRAACCC